MRSRYCRRNLKSRPGIEHLERRDQPSFLVAPAYTIGGIGGVPMDVAAADFNADGANDLIIGKQSGFVRVFQNTGAGAFAPTVDLPASGYDIRGVAPGDFNNDGFPDFVTASFGVGGSVGRVALFVNDGQGVFEFRQEYNAGGALSSIVASDLTGDGHLDLAVSSYNNQAVSVFRGTGIGKFRRVGTFAAGNSPQSLTVGDFNGDTIPDLVVANNSSANTVTVLVGTGGGIFQAGVSYAAGTSPSGVATADFDGDGDLDLAVSNKTQSNGRINILLGNGDSTFAAPVEYAFGVSPSDIAAADLDLDGDVDLAVADDSKLGKVGVLLGNGNGTFGTPVGYQAGIRLSSVLVTELNGDSQPDLAVTSLNNSTVSTLFGTGGGEFSAALVDPTSAHTDSLVTADFNSDTLPDLAGFMVFNNGTQAKLLVSLGIGGGQFVQLAEAALPNHPAALSVGDFNNDATPDIAYGRYSGILTVLLGNGDGTFAAGIDHATNGDITSIAIADLNEDGNADAVTANPFSHDLRVLLGNGDGTLQPAISYAAAPMPRSVDIGDFNGDGVLDLATANHDKDIRTVSVLLGNGDGTFQSAIPSIAATSRYPIDTAEGDFNMDGKLDLAVAVYGNNGALNVLLGNGDGTFQAPVGYVTSQSFKRVVTADFSGDGILDLAITNDKVNGGEPLLYVLQGNGNGTFETAAPYFVGPSPYDIVIADFNADSRPDLALNQGNVVSTPDNVAIVLNDGNWPAPISIGGRLIASPITANEPEYGTISPTLTETSLDRIVRNAEPASKAKPASRALARIMRPLAGDDIIRGNF